MVSSVPSSSGSPPRRPPRTLQAFHTDLSPRLAMSENEVRQVQKKMGTLARDRDRFNLGETTMVHAETTALDDLYRWIFHASSIMDNNQSARLICNYQAGG